MTNDEYILIKHSYNLKFDRPCDKWQKTQSQVHPSYRVLSLLQDSLTPRDPSVKACTELQIEYALNYTPWQHDAI